VASRFVLNRRLNKFMATIHQNSVRTSQKTLSLEYKDLGYVVYRNHTWENAEVLMLSQAVHIIISFVYVVMNYHTKGGKFFGLRAF